LWRVFRIGCRGAGSAWDGGRSFRSYGAAGSSRGERPLANGESASRGIQIRVRCLQRRARNVSASKPLSATARRWRKQGKSGSTAKNSWRCPPGQTGRDGSAASLNDRGQLRANSTLSATDRLGSLAAARVRPILTQPYVRAIDIPQLTRGSRRNECRHRGKQPGGTPAAKPRIDLAPRTELLRQVAPRDAGSQDVEYPREHRSIILRRTPAQRPPAGLTPRAVDFFAFAATARAALCAGSVSCVWWD